MALLKSAPRKEAQRKMAPRKSASRKVSASTVRNVAPDRFLIVIIGLVLSRGFEVRSADCLRFAACSVA
jgi:hypothetical protein